MQRICGVYSHRLRMSEQRRQSWTDPGCGVTGRGTPECEPRMDWRLEGTHESLPRFSKAWPENSPVQFDDEAASPDSMKAGRSPLGLCMSLAANFEAVELRLRVVECDRRGIGPTVTGKFTAMRTALRVGLTLIAATIFLYVFMVTVKADRLRWVLARLGRHPRRRCRVTTARRSTASPAAFRWPSTA